MSLPVAFYAPLKSPDHPSPSGDRTVARLMRDALGLAGFAPTLASDLRSLDLDGDPDRQLSIRNAAREEAARLVAGWGRGPVAARPRLWFTYHCHYKAPDWIGPAVADELGIPYVVAEGSRASKRAGGRWAAGHDGAEAALDRADIVFASTAHDAEALRRDCPPGGRVVDLPPFLDAAAWAPSRPRDRPNGPPCLLAVAMMRAGDKLASYSVLAEALAMRLDRPWRLRVAGDGPASAEVEAAFAPLAGRVEWLGVVEAPAGMAALYSASDLLVWPAINEAYGMALLEAQAAGCPVLAGRVGGVPEVVRDGATGVLVPPADPAAFADALAGLLDDPGRLKALGRSAREVVARDHGLATAAGRLKACLLPLLDRAEAA